MSLAGIITFIVVGMVIAFTFLLTSSRIVNYMLKDWELWTGPYFREVRDGRNPSQTLEYVGPSELLSRNTD